MIKRYNQFIKENDEFMEEPSFEETEGRLAEEDLKQELDQSEEAGEEEEAGDIYKNRLNELAEKLGTEVVDGKINYNGQTIIFPSETEMYHVGKKKFKTADEVVDFLEGTENKTQELPEIEEEMAESKSYKNKFNFVNESYDSSIKMTDVNEIINKIKQISKIEIVDNTADIDYLIEKLESALSSYDQETVEEVIDLMLFNYPDVSEEYIINKIIQLGDRIFDKYGTEPKMVLLAFEDAFHELSKHFNISEKKKPGRPKSGRTKSGRKVPGKYLTKNRKLMKKEIEEFQGKDTYKTEWDADYKSGKGGQGKRHKTKKSAATKAYQKMFEHINRF